MSDLRERLADAAHEGWRKQYKASGRHDKDFLDVPYAELTEGWKDYDRATADAMLPVTQAEIAAWVRKAGEVNCPHCAGPSPDHPGYIKSEVCWCEKLRLWGDPSNTFKVPHHHYKIGEREYISKCEGEHIRALLETLRTDPSRTPNTGAKP